jgi:hypothetical protein
MKLQVSTDHDRHQFVSSSRTSMTLMPLWPQHKIPEAAATISAIGVIGTADAF